MLMQVLLIFNLKIHNFGKKNPEFSRDVKEVSFRGFYYMLYVSCDGQFV